MNGLHATIIARLCFVKVSPGKNPILFQQTEKVRKLLNINVDVLQAFPSHPESMENFLGVRKGRVGKRYREDTADFQSIACSR